MKRAMLGTRWSLVSRSVQACSKLFNSTSSIVEGTSIRQTFESPGEKHDSSTTSIISEPFSSYISGLGHPLSRNEHSSDTLPGASIQTLLPLLEAQGPHYITVHVHARPYLLMIGDTLRLPFRMPGVVPGDILRFNRASNIGSRDFTLKGAPYIDERLFECRARVMGVEAEPMRIKEKRKRRQRRVKTVRSKHRFTILKISELKINLSDGIEV
jgi:large subunit ribosomal protein L21